jgi:hypothetical protein
MLFLSLLKLWATAPTGYGGQFYIEVVSVTNRMQALD